MWQSIQKLLGKNVQNDHNLIFKLLKFELNVKNDYTQSTPVPNLAFLGTAGCSIDHKHTHTGIHFYLC